eukprot:TRINITY_DN10473_c0_g1_i1.p1 TRINITY_DN10473_c0_g1~~TRINITY_DN10473_c0_g1_i1.p1  ORF type:complete len:231 (+),score=78.08 TRINITY_DN10473_c0_g1_i1:81-773(+)
MSDQQEQSTVEEDQQTAAQVEAENTTQYEPVVSLNEVNTKTGEEDEEIIYKHRCALYRYVDSEWKERGKGDVKFLKHATTGRVRAIMRQEKTLKLVLNQIVDPSTELKQNAGSDRAWTWANLDYSDDTPTRYAFAIKFKTAELANAFKAVYDECRTSNEAVAKGGKPTVKKHLEEDDEPKKTEKKEETKKTEEPKTEEKKEEKKEEPKKEEEAKKEEPKKDDKVAEAPKA